jgi:septal ring factor EnvC (AmiA/AmiB activator)
MFVIRQLILPALIAFQVIPSFAADSGQAEIQEERLQQLRSRISDLKIELGSMHGKKSAVETDLEKAEREIGAVASTLHQLDQKIERTQARLDELIHERQDRQQQLQAIQVMLARELRSAYVMGEQEQVKLLLNQDDPAAIARLMVYYGYFSRARADRIRGMKSAIDDLTRIGREIRDQKSGLENLKEEQIAESDRLQGIRSQRKQVLTRLQAQLEQKSTELNALQRDEQNLQQLVESLRRTLRAIPPAAAKYKSLSPMKGTLVWPVEGPIGMRFGALQADGKLRSRGVLISASAGADVHAIASGRVVFADWLRGFGLLLIIDHGKGYMSLYGYNRSLFREVGDSVEAGEVIAAVGDSGGRDRSGLYLELRKDGRPFDPVPWFSGNPAVRHAGN